MAYPVHTALLTVSGGQPRKFVNNRPTLVGFRLVPGDDSRVTEEDNLRSGELTACHNIEVEALEDAIRSTWHTPLR